MSDNVSIVKGVLTEGCGLYSFFQGLCVSLCCFLIVTCIGVLLYKSNTNYTGKTSANINTSHCNSRVVYQNNRNNVYYDCDIDLSYKVNNKDYSGNLHTSTETNYDVRRKVDIDYVPSNPQLIQLHQVFSNKVIAIILFIVAGLCLICMMSHTGMYLTNDWYKQKLCADLFRSNNYNSSYNRSLISIF